MGNPSSGWNRSATISTVRPEEGPESCEEHLGSPLHHVAEGYTAMDDQRASKTLRKRLQALCAEGDPPGSNHP